MKKALLMTTSIAALLTLTGCAVRGPTVWVEPPAYYGPAVIVEPTPVIVVEERHYYQDRHYHKKHKKHKRHYHRHD